AYQKKQFTWKDIKNSLQPNEAAIEIVRFNYYEKHWTDTVYYAALIVTKDCEYPKLVLFENGKDLEGDFLKYYRQFMEIKETESGYLREPGCDFESYNRFWKPIKDVLPAGIDRICLSPDGVYNNINLYSLFNPDTKKYVIEEQIDIRLVGSTRDIINKENEPIAEVNKTAALFGDPIFYYQPQLASNITNNKDIIQPSNSSENNSSRKVYRKDVECSLGMEYQQLPNTRKEIDSSETTLNQYEYTVKKKLGDSANEEEVKKLKSPGILHLSTHGYFCSDVERKEDMFTMGFEEKRFIENPLLRSGLLLTGGGTTIKNAENPDAETNYQNEDGLLTAYEVMNLNLDSTDLVILSACKTGLGDVVNGEGVYGLQRAFKVAGAKSIIMSLWSVLDKPTNILQQKFYEYWLNSKMDKQSAFKEAQLYLMKNTKWVYPRDWGGFVIIGN
ncbi:CHAT domain-containing protein, partial [Bacteroidota bacterium]